MAKNISETERESAPLSLRAERVRIRTRVEKMAGAANAWAAAAEQAAVWDVHRCAQLAQRAAEVASKEAAKGQKDLDEPTLEVVKGFVSSAQEATIRASTAAQQAPSFTYQPFIVEQLRVAKRQAWADWLMRYPNDGQPEAELMIAHLRLAHDLIAQQLVAAENELSQRSVPVTTIA